MPKLEGQQKINRYKIGTGSKGYLVVKPTSPDIKKMPIGKAKPSRPQGKQNMGVGGSKATMRHKGRVDPKAADPKDPGAYPMPNTKINYLTPDKFAQKGYIKDRGWPEGDTGGKPEMKISDPAPTRKV